MTERVHLDPRSAREATIWRVLRATYTRVACRFSGLDPARLSQDEQDALLEHWHSAMQHDLRVLMSVAEHAYNDGVQRVHGLLHGTENTDNEMLDQAVECAIAEEREREEAER